MCGVTAAVPGLGFLDYQNRNEDDCRNYLQGLSFLPFLVCVFDFLLIVLSF